MTKGFIHVVTSPVAGDIFINGEYRGTQNVNIEADVGTYTISFGNVSGYVTPQQLTVTVNPNVVTLVTAEYVRQ